MAITGKGWELRIVRHSMQRRKSDGKVRTVGAYQVYHDGVALKEPWAFGATAETRGPGDNKTAGNNRRIEAGTYALWTQAGAKYVTLDFTSSLSPKAYPKPGIELKGTGKRQEILFHPGQGFLASIGCINPCGVLLNADDYFDYLPSRQRVIEIILDMRRYFGAKFPKANGKPITGASIVIEGEP